MGLFDAVVVKVENYLVVFLHLAILWSAGFIALCIENNTRIITLNNILFLGNSCTNGLLQKAAKSGNFPVVKFLQENGADVNATTRDDTNPSLVHAAREGFYRWSYLLYQIGIRQRFKVKCNYSGHIFKPSCQNFSLFRIRTKK